MSSKPVKTIQAADYCTPHISHIYDGDFIYDRFDCSFSGDGMHVVTGGYDNTVHVYDRYGKTHTRLDVSSNTSVSAFFQEEVARVADNLPRAPFSNAGDAEYKGRSAAPMHLIPGSAGNCDQMKIPQLSSPEVDSPGQATTLSDFQRFFLSKVGAVAHHPSEDLIAACTINQVYLYKGEWALPENNDHT